MLSNLVTIDSPEHFQKALSADLERVSVTNFWAPWAEPCKDMNDAVVELAKKYTKILFLNVCAAARARLSLDRVCAE
jgi:thiol-disulfide isomerase/thioredoxin